jgi:dTDP-4-dehydrorhamnose reductase
VIAVLGSRGQLGSAFARLLGDEAVLLTRSDLDLRNHDGIRAWVQSARPEVILNCAAYTAVDAAESDQHTARAVNALAVGALAQACSVTGTRLVTFSTDYVFDGRKQTPYVESDPPDPLNVYGATKAEGERLALEINPGTLVIRTSWLLSTTHRNFLTVMLDRLAEGEVAVVDDQRGRPTFADDLAAATLDALRAGTSGILHLTNQGETTWYDLARAVAELAGFHPHRIQPTTSAALGRAALRPANSVLDSERLGELGLRPLPEWREGLAAAMARVSRQGESAPGSPSPEG